jgi:tRNA A58 N-methylase Trm61
MISAGNINQYDIVYDLGCGDGGILISVACHTKAKCFGYEIDGVLCSIGRRKAKENNVDHLVTITEADILDVNYSDASVICLFLTPSCLQFLSDRLKNNCKSGTRIICYKFPLPEADGWIPTNQRETDDVINTMNHNSKSYIYTYSI